jgi:hypothetical protein
MVSATVLVLTAVLYYLKPKVFIFFLNDLNPLSVVSVLAVAGYLLLGALRPYGFMVYRARDNADPIKFILMAVVLAMIMIMVDVTVHLPEDMNVGPPYSLMYYPVFGYVVEVLFHLAPAFILIFSLKTITSLNNNIIGAALLIVALIEPVFQLGLGFSSQVPGWAAVYVGVHIFLINAMQLYLFARFDFVSMYVFRLVYYLFWHIIWGYLRLGLLF